MITEFIVAKVSTTYNAIIDRLILYEFCAIVCIWYLYKKMPSEDGPITVRGRQLEAKYYHSISLGTNREEEVLVSKVTKIEGNISDKRIEPIWELEAFPISKKYPNRCTHVNAHLKPHQKTTIKEFIMSH